MLVIILWFVFSMLVGAVAKNRKLGEWPGFFLALLLSPVIGLLIALVSPRKEVPVIYNNYTPSEADQIKKIYKLKESGAITDEEFIAMKAKLLK